MSHHADSGNRTLVVRAEAYFCALPLVHVVETMRALPIEPVADMPPFVRGVSIVRGQPMPVVDLAVLLGMPSGAAERFVTLRVANRQVALAVSGVIGVRDLDLSTLQELPPLLHGASREVIEAIGTLDRQVLVVLRTGWELPDAVWQTLTTQEVAS